MKKEETICVMCYKKAETVLQGNNLINAALCISCSKLIDELIEHCNLDWSFRFGVNTK